MDDAPHRCSVAVLVPHPRSPAFLTRADGGLPLFDVVRDDLDGPTPADLERSLTAELGEPGTLLRTVAVGWTDDFAITQLVVELEAFGAKPPVGYAWVELEPGSGAEVEPGWASPTFVPWLHERRTGWSPRRPAWSRPGWFAEASSWMTEQMLAAGMREPEPPRIHQLWGLSVVLSAGSAEGPAFFKCSGPRFRHEPELTRALAASTPERFPEVLAVEPERGWMLMRGFGDRILGDQPTTMWGAGLDALAGVQRTWFGRADELLATGAEQRSLAALTEWVAGRDLEPELLDACRRLAELGPGQTLVHGDLHPWNVAITAAGPLLFDWTDGALGHPFLDLATYVTRTPHVDVRHHLVVRYLAHWSDLMSPAELAEAGRLALVVGSLYQAWTYAGLIPTVLPEDLGELADGESDWLARALRRHRVGLHGGY